MRKTAAYFCLAAFFYGCAPSIIKVDAYIDHDPYLQYGRSPNRQFYFDKTLDLTLSEKWEVDINGGFSNSSVTVFDSVLFVNDLSGRIYSFTLSKGKILGQLKYKGSIFTTPVIYNSLIIFAVVNDKENSSTIYFYDYRNGKETASKEISGRVTSQIILIDSGILVLAEKGILYKLGFNGTLLWQYETKSFTHSSPASDSIAIIFGNDDGEIICMSSDNSSISPVNAVAEKYRKKIGTPFFSGTVLNENSIYIGNDSGNFYSIDKKTGEVNWTFNTNSRIIMEAAIEGDEVYIGNLKGEFYKLSKSNGTQIWKTDTKGLLNITPIITKNYVVLPDANRKLYFIDRMNGEIAKSILFDGRLKLSPVIKDNLLFIGYENGNLKAYEIN